MFVAVGNAAFHSAQLYGPLRQSIYPLLSALDDEDEKTRANAAGALGNLVRNASDLAQALCDAGAIDRLLFMCMREPKIFPQVIDVTPTCSALPEFLHNNCAEDCAVFSRNNGWIRRVQVIRRSYLQYDKCSFFIVFRNKIMGTKHGINDVLHHIKLEEPMKRDEAMQKYLVRLRSKLKKPQQSQQS